MKLLATVKEAVADIQVELSQEEDAEARPGALGPRTDQDGGAEQPDIRQRPADLRPGRAYPLRYARHGRCSAGRPNQVSREPASSNKCL